MTREEYHAYLRSPQWREKREAVLKRCGNKCEDCQEERRFNEFVRPARAVEVHHLTYERIGRERLSDLIGVCGRHHDYRHSLDERENQRQAARQERLDKWQTELDAAVGANDTPASYANRYGD